MVGLALLSLVLVVTSGVVIQLIRQITAGNERLLMQGGIRNLSWYLTIDVAATKDFHFVNAQGTPVVPRPTGTPTPNAVISGVEAVLTAPDLVLSPPQTFLIEYRLEPDGDLTRDNRLGAPIVVAQRVEQITFETNLSVSQTITVSVTFRQPFGAPSETARFALVRRPADPTPSPTPPPTP